MENEREGKIRGIEKDGVKEYRRGRERIVEN